MPQFYFWGPACKTEFCESQFCLENVNNASFLIDWYVTSKQVLVLIFSAPPHKRGPRAQSRLPRTRTWHSRVWLRLVPIPPWRREDPTLAQRPAPTANAQALQEEQRGACAEGARRGRLRSLGCNPRSGVLAPPRTLFINTPRGHRRGVTLKVVGSEVRGQQRRRPGDPSLHLLKLQTACRAQPSRPTAIRGC